MKTNPNNANQYVMDPRQKKCWELYINSNSKTFANAYQSAVEAGYEASYAEVITTRPWFEEKVRKLNLVNKAEKNLNDLLGSEDERVKADMTKFTLSRLKKEDYSERSEVTGKDGKDFKLVVVSEDLQKKYEADTSSIDNS